MRRLTPFLLVALTGVADASWQEVDDPPVIQDDLEALLDDGLDELLGGDGLGEFDRTGDGSDPLTSWKGFFEIRPRVYFQDRDKGQNNEQLILESELELDFQFSESLSGYFRPRFYVDSLDGDLERFEPFEAYLTHEDRNYDVRVGQLVENWGIVDTYNPIDVINRRDLATDFLDVTRQGELGIRVRRFLKGDDRIGEPTLSFYALPVWRRTRFAPEDQRFAFVLPGVRFDEDGGFEPEGSERAMFAARFASTYSSKPVNADFQVLLARGPERSPAVVLGPAAEFVPAYFGASTLGMGFRAVPNEASAGRFLSTLTLKAEVVYKHPYRFDHRGLSTPDDFVAYVLGVDRQFYNVFNDQDVVTVTVEYAGEDGAHDMTRNFRPFRDDLIMRAFWDRNDFARTSVEVRGIYDLDNHEVILEGVLERQLRALHEDLKLTLQVQWFDPPGNGKSLFDYFPNNSSVAVGLRWDFGS